MKTAKVFHHVRFAIYGILQILSMVLCIQAVIVLRQLNYPVVVFFKLPIDDLSIHAMYTTQCKATYV